MSRLLAVVCLCLLALSASTAAQAHPRPFPSWWLRAALCVHQHEGSWHANTGNGFTGGMQFLDSTWLSNGGGRYAARAFLASPHEQLHVAFVLWQRAGWGPWPNTSRMCGLR